MAAKLTLRPAGAVSAPERLPAVIDIPVPERFSDVGKFEAAATEQYRRAQASIVRFGRILLAGRDSFEHGEFGAALARIAAECGASTQTLHRAMRLADGIPSLPGDAAAWEQAPSLADEALAARKKMTPETFAAGVEQGVITPLSTVQALRAYAAAHASGRQPKPPGRLKLERERARLLARLAQIDAALAAL